MTTFNWDCRTVDVYPTSGDNTDVVYNVHWRLTGVSDQLDANDNPYSATVIGTQTLSTEEIVDFVPFEELTHEQIVTWVQDAIGAEQVTQMEDNVNNQIDSLITPTSVTKTIEL
jgi:hypothetical protein